VASKFTDVTGTSPISTEELVKQMEAQESNAGQSKHRVSPSDGSMSPSGRQLTENELTLREIRLVTEKLSDIAKSHRFRIHPEGSFMVKWDMMMLVALLFTAIVTPYEIAFIETVPWDTMFTVNRAVDILFLFDLIFSFFVMFYDTDGRLVKNWYRIARRYLTGMFIVDFLSILPFDTVKFMAPELSDTTIRFMRLPRLLKLLRLSRVIKIFRRWESYFGVLHQSMMMAQLAMMLFLLNHWMACLWVSILDVGQYTVLWVSILYVGEYVYCTTHVLMPSCIDAFPPQGMLPYLQGEDSFTWFSAWLTSREFINLRPAICGEEAEVINAVFRGEPGECFTHTEIYVPALHWAMMTGKGLACY
jgi:hypothetical protein